MGSNPGKTHLPFIYPPGQHHKLTVMSPSEIISSFQYQIHENAWDTLNKKWHFFLLPLTNSRFYLFRMHKAKGSAGAESPSAMGEKVCARQSSGFGVGLSPMGWAGLAAEQGPDFGMILGKKPSRDESPAHPCSVWAPWQQNIQPGINPLFLPVWVSL